MGKITFIRSVAVSGIILPLLSCSDTKFGSGQVAKPAGTPVAAASTVDNGCKLTADQKFYNHIVLLASQKWPIPAELNNSVGLTLDSSGTPNQITINGVEMPRATTFSIPVASLADVSSPDAIQAKTIVAEVAEASGKKYSCSITLNFVALVVEQVLTAAQIPDIGSNNKTGFHTHDVMVSNLPDDMSLSSVEYTQINADLKVIGCRKLGNRETVTPIEGVTLGKETNRCIVAYRASADKIFTYEETLRKLHLKGSFGEKDYSMARLSITINPPEKLIPKAQNLGVIHIGSSVLDQGVTLSPATFASDAALQVEAEPFFSK